MRFVVPRKGFEPSPPNKQGQGSKPCASANSATSALHNYFNRKLSSKADPPLAEKLRI